MKIRRWLGGHCYVKVKDNVKMARWVAPCGLVKVSMPSSAPKKLTISMPAACPKCLEVYRSES